MNVFKLNFLAYIFNVVLCVLFVINIIPAAFMYKRKNISESGRYYCVLCWAVFQCLTVLHEVLLIYALSGAAFNKFESTFLKSLMVSSLIIFYAMEIAIFVLVLKVLCSMEIPDPAMPVQQDRSELLNNEVPVGISIAPQEYSVVDLL